MTSSFFAFALVALCGALTGSFVVYALARRSFSGKLSEKDGLLASKSEAIASTEVELARREAELEASRNLAVEMKIRYDETIKSIKEEHEQTLSRQIGAVKAELAAENARIQKEREESLKKEAQETFQGIAGSLDKDIRKMTESFEAQRKEHSESAATIRTKFEETAKILVNQTEMVGKGAERLASALRGQNKMQGCWGETILENIFKEEGLVEGRDFDREVTLRDADGNVLRNVDSGSRMRPDFILHYPSDIDVIVDSKVSLSALSDYYSAQTDEARDDAARRNLKSVWDHVKELASKDYQRHALASRKTLDYVVMFIPNYSSFQLAKQLDPDIFADAFRQNVLITTEETIMPFLRIIRTAWVNQEQINNLQKIIDNAQIMVERVADFCTANAAVGKKLEDALDIHEKSSKKLREGGQSIVHSAREILKLGVPSRKALPEESNQ